MSDPCFPLSCNMGSSAITLEELSCGKGACACGFVVLREGNVPLGRQQVRRQEKSRTACKSWFPLSTSAFAACHMPCCHSSGFRCSLSSGCTWVRWFCTEQCVWGLFVRLPSNENQLREKGLGQSVNMLRRCSLNLDSVNFEHGIPLCGAESAMLVAPQLSHHPPVLLSCCWWSSATGSTFSTTAEGLEGPWVRSAQQFCTRAPCAWAASHAEGSWTPLSAATPHWALCPEHRVPGYVI